MTVAARRKGSTLSGEEMEEIRRPIRKNPNLLSTHSGGRENIRQPSKRKFTKMGEA